jgi:hypothetical protein
MEHAAKPRLAVRLFNGVHRLAQALGRKPPRFAESETALVEAACRATHLDDFGDDAFRAHLRVLLRAYDEEAHLTPFGRMMVMQEISGILKNRLSVQHAWTQQPNILQGSIRRPIFILGLPRTGTTALHFLLGEDPHNQVLESWLAAAPGPRPPRSEWEKDPRFVAAVRGLKMMYYLDPSLKAIHLMTADGPDECRHLFLQSFLDDTFDSNATIPSYTKWYAQQDMHPVYARHRDILKLIQTPPLCAPRPQEPQPERRWVLKYPAHMRNLRVLLETYPDACIVQTHRDPARVLPSICSLVAGWRGLYEGAVDRHAIGRWQLDMWSGMVQTAIDVRETSPATQFYDFSFMELTADPIAAIKRMYAHFGLDFTADAEQRMRAWHAANPQGKHGGHHYAAADFGLSNEAIAERFAPYMQRFQVVKESAGS